MKRTLIVLAIICISATASYAQVITADEANFLKTTKLIQKIQKQIEDKQAQMNDAISAVRAQYSVEIDLLKSQLNDAETSLEAVVRK